MGYQEESALIEELRKRLLSRGPELKEFDKRDIDHAHQSDGYIWSFLKHKHGDMEKALEMMVGCFKWRLNFGVNDIMERNIDRRLFEVGFLYPYNKDKHGNILLIFHMKKYKKEIFDVDEVKKLFVFGLEKLCTQSPDKQVTMIFDMQDSSLSNMDTDLIKFMIACFQSYFPSMLEYLIVYETPWILSAAWKIVKGSMNNDGASQMKMVNKGEIMNYVASDQLLTTMGGTDDFVYKYPPQLFSKSVDNQLIDKRVQNVSSKVDVFSSLTMSVDNGDKDIKSEKFSVIKYDGVNQTTNSSSEIMDNSQEMLNPRQKANGKVKHRSRKPLENIGPLLTISPASELVFYGTNSSDILQTISISNTVSSTVAFKIKTTTPENFRVRPSCGPIPPGNSIEVQIHLQQGHDPLTVAKDKFLILSTIVPEQEKTDMNTIWKSIPRSSIMEQKLRCRLDRSMCHESDPESFNSKMSDKSCAALLMLSKQFQEFNTKLDELQSHVSLLERDVKVAFRLLLIILFVFIITVIAKVLFLSTDYISK